jgi:hypothetical protein
MQESPIHAGDAQQARLFLRKQRSLAECSLRCRECFFSCIQHGCRVYMTQANLAAAFYMVGLQ